MVFNSTLRGAREASQTISDAVFQHADAIQHLAEALEEEVQNYTQELANRISMLHDSAGKITSAGLEIARAGDRIALCGEHLALGMQQLVIVVAASMLTVVAGLFGWRYLVLGAMCLWLCGFELTRHQRTPPPGPQTPDGVGGSQQSPNGDGHQQLHSALHQPGVGMGSPKRVSFEHGTASSQATTDSTVPTPRNEAADSVQGAIGVCINKATSLLAAASPAAARADGDGYVRGDGDGHGHGNVDTDGDGTAPQPSGEMSVGAAGIGLSASVDAAEQLAARIRQRSAQMEEQRGATSRVQHVG